MYKELSKIILAAVMFSIVSIESKMLSETNLDDGLLELSVNTIIEKLDVNNSTFSLIEKTSFLDSIALLCISKNDTIGLYDVLVKKIDLGERSVLLLEDFSGRFLRSNSPSLYNRLENYLNWSFIQYCKDFYPNINLELTFLYRYLFRMDQRFKLSAQDFKENKAVLDSLRHLSQSQDSITEVILDNLFNNYGIPTFEDVGPESNNLMIFLTHLSPDFVFRHIGKVQIMILNKELYTSVESFEFVVDKALHRKFGLTIYNTVWNKHSPKVNDDVELSKIKTTLRIK
jgi:hypothetical protein